MWALMDECPLELREPEHLATGMRHYLRGYLMHLGATHLRVATGTTYLFACNGWQKIGLGVRKAAAQARMLESVADSNMRA